MKKIAFCFLIYDQIEAEDLWNAFFSNSDKSLYNIYIHYKINKPLFFLEKYKMPECIKTKYADLSLIHAQNKMFQYAFEHDWDNYKFVLLSGSCIPLKSFTTIYNTLISTTKGYINVCPTEQCFPNCNPLLKYLPRKYISKSSQWIILNRKLVYSITYRHNRIIDKFFKKIYAPEEIFYYSFIRFANLENEVEICNSGIENATTFTNWEGNNYKYPSTKGIKNYNTISKEEIIYLLLSPCLFGRKFMRNCIIENTDNYLSDFIHDNIIRPGF